MALLESRVERTDDFARRQARMEQLVEELRERTRTVAAGGGERASSGTARAASCSRASGSTGWSTRARRSWS